MRPRMLRAQQSQGAPLEMMAPDPGEPLAVRPEHVRLVTRAMVDVNRFGTSRVVFEGAEYQAAGKTGTAQVMDARNHKTGQTTWFASFGGTGEDRRYAVVVMVEDGRSGGESCAPLAHDVYAAIRDIERPPAAVARNN